MHEQIFLLFAKKWLTDRQKERRLRQYVNPKRSNSQLEVNKCNQWNVGDVCKKNCQHQLQIKTIWISIVCFTDGVSLQCICSRVLKHIISQNNVYKKNLWPCPPKQGSHSDSSAQTHECNTVQLWVLIQGHLGSWPWLRPSDLCLGLDRHSWP